MTDEEAAASNALETMLKARGYYARWEPVPNDPPDAKFWVGETEEQAERWGVEITGLFQYVEHDGTEVSARAFEIAFVRMCERLQTELPPASDRGYIISSMRQLLAGPELREIEENARDYIRTGRTGPKALDSHIAELPYAHELRTHAGNPAVLANIRATIEAQQRIHIEDSGEAGQVQYITGIGAQVQLPGGELAANLDETTRYALDRILTRKIPRLATLNGFDRKLLLIWSDYLFAKPERVRVLLADMLLPPAAIVDAVILLGERGEAFCVANPAGIRVFVA